ncbi:hypothetical protein NESM_000882100 [Novymonas esmeraldas]|uniref:Surface antigen-like protein n=1 Tax=Novymonas esmeraldas TaxID=1808958 RepID=A0AAW0F215_9TRYP
MTSSSTRYVYLALLVAVTCTMALGYDTGCNIPHCTSCLLGHCTYCESGYFPVNGTCASCQSDHCRSCLVTGHCTSCNDGYELTYIDLTASESTFPRYGACKPKTTASTCDDDKCVSCLGGHCLFCKPNHYAKDGVCVSCDAPNCAHCAFAGRCISCENKYRLVYVNFTDDGVQTYRWGRCISNAAASFASGLVAAVAAVVVALAMLMA